MLTTTCQWNFLPPTWPTWKLTIQVRWPSVLFSNPWELKNSTSVFCCLVASSTQEVVGWKSVGAEGKIPQSFCQGQPRFCSLQHRTLKPAPVEFGMSPFAISAHTPCLPTGSSSYRTHLPACLGPSCINHSLTGWGWRPTFFNAIWWLSVTTSCSLVISLPCVPNSWVVKVHVT